MYLKEIIYMKPNTMCHEYPRKILESVIHISKWINMDLREVSIVNGIYMKFTINARELGTQRHGRALA